MKYNFNTGLVLGGLSALIVCTIIYTRSFNSTIKEFRTQAIKYNYAEWIVHPYTGESKWKWKEPKTYGDPISDLK